jgi:hypothetical protein
VTWNLEITSTFAWMGFSSPANKRILIGVEVLPPVAMTSYVCWDITQCSPLRVNGRFGGTHHLHLQSWRVSQAWSRQQGVLCFSLKALKTTAILLINHLWSRGQSSWLQIQMSGFDSRPYQIIWEVVGMERGPLSLASTTEELIEIESSSSSLEIW